MAGERTTAGSALFAESPPKERDAPIVANLTAAGLVALGKTIDKVWRGFEVKEVRLSVRLCAVYWHFLLALWLVLFTLLTPWVGNFAVICRQLLI